jgi:hypothetical protein
VEELEIVTALVDRDCEELWWEELLQAGGGDRPRAFAASAASPGGSGQSGLSPDKEGRK